MPTRHHGPRVGNRLRRVSRGRCQRATALGDEVRGPTALAPFLLFVTLDRVNPVAAVESTLEGLLAAESFEDGAGTLLGAMLDLVEEALAASPWATRARVLRGVVQLRRND